MLFVLFSAFFLSTAADTATLERNTPEEDNPRGERVRVHITGYPPLTGELISAEFNYLAVLLDHHSAPTVSRERTGPTIAFIYYEAISRLRVGFRSYRVGRLSPTGPAMQDLRLGSRYPPGITSEQVEELLESLDQEDIYEIRL